MSGVAARGGAASASGTGAPGSGAKRASSGTILDKPFEPTLTKAAAAKAGLAKAAPPPNDDADDEPTGRVTGVPAGRTPTGERRRSRGLAEDLAAAAEAALSGSSGASRLFDAVKPSAARANAAGLGTAKSDVRPAAGSPATSDAVPPVGEQRTKEQAGSQQAGSQQAGSQQAGSQQAGPPQAGPPQAGSPQGGSQQAGAPGAERTDSAVPVARTSQDQGQGAELQNAAGQAGGGRRRKPADASTDKLSRTARRSGQSRQSGKG